MDLTIIIFLYNFRKEIKIDCLKNMLHQQAGIHGDSEIIYTHTLADYYNGSLVYPRGYTTLLNIDTVEDTYNILKFIFPEYIDYSINNTEIVNIPVNHIKLLNVYGDKYTYIYSISKKFINKWYKISISLNDSHIYDRRSLEYYNDMEYSLTQFNPATALFHSLPSKKYNIYGDREIMLSSDSMILSHDGYFKPANQIVNGDTFLISVGQTPLIGNVKSVDKVNEETYAYYIIFNNDDYHSSYTANYVNI